MSKELVDREMLERIVNTNMADYAVIAYQHKEIRAILAQPAEAEGVDVVAWRCEASKPAIKTQVRLVFTWPEAESFALHYEGIGCKVTTTALVEKAKHLAALSAVTAERDRLREALGDKALCAAYAERQKLLAEVEALRKAPAGWAKMDPAFVVEHIRETTVFDADMIEAMLEFAIGAAMAAKEA